MRCERRTERKSKARLKELVLDGDLIRAGKETDRVKGENVSINKSQNEEEIITCSPFRACVIMTSPSGVRSNRMTFPLCLNLGAPATYNLLQFPTTTEDTV